MIGLSGKDRGLDKSGFRAVILDLPIKEKRRRFRSGYVFCLKFSTAFPVKIWVLL